MTHLLQQLTRLLAAMALTSLLSACFLTNILPEGEKNKTSTPPRPSPSIEQKPKPKIPPPAQLPAGRLARRLALDLVGRLPLANDKLELSADPTYYTDLIQAYLEDSDSGRALAQVHTQMWHLAPVQLKQLDKFAETDSTLATQLTDNVRREISSEPANLMRYIIENNRPLSDVFSLDFQIIHSDVLPIWDVTSAGTAFPNETLHFAFPPTDRPAAGLLTNYGLLASLSDPDDVTGEHRIKRLFQEILCQGEDESSSHTFYNLEAANLGVKLATTKLSHQTCAACHARYYDVAISSEGLADGATISAWLDYTPPTTPGGRWGSVAYANWQDLGTQIAGDPRFLRCETNKLLSALEQRPATASDAKTINLALLDYTSQQQHLKALIPQLVQSDSYKQDATDKITNAVLVRQQSGVRFLTIWQWQRLINQLIPTVANSSQIELPDALEAGNDEFSGNYNLPTGTYWHEVDRLARQLATAIIDAELSDEAVANGRVLLTNLPNGDASTANKATVTLQIKALWAKLTGTALSDTDPLLTEFVTLWNTALVEETTATATRRAWRTVLVAMLSHPDFVTY